MEKFWGQLKSLQKTPKQNNKAKKQKQTKNHPPNKHKKKTPTPQKKKKGRECIHLNFTS